jgi:hypothetical protein
MQRQVNCDTIYTIIGVHLSRPHLYQIQLRQPLMQTSAIQEFVHASASLYYRSLRHLQLAAALSATAACNNAKDVSIRRILVLMSNASRT